MKGLGLVLVVVIVLVLVMGHGSTSTGASTRQQVGPPLDTSFDQAVRDAALNLPPAGTPGRPGPDIVDRCHQGFTAGTAAVSSAYGAPKSAASIGAKVNPYYYACDAGGYVIKGAEAVGHFFGGLF